jgi:hypothetical protein
LAIGVRTNGGAAFATLNPRQALTATPYAIYAGSVGASNIVGNISPGQLPADVALRTGDNTFTGNQFITSGNVGIGTTTPATRLTVVTPDNSYGIEHTDGTRRLSTFLGNGAWFGTVSPDPFYLFVNDGAPALTIGTNSNVGIGTSFPGASTLQINDPFLTPIAAGLQVNHPINGAYIQINRGPGQGGAGLWVDNSGAGDANTSLLMLRNNVGSSPQTVLNVTADGTVQGLQFQGSGSGLSGLNASQLTGGTMPDARLSANVALRSGANIFSGNQTINGFLNLNGVFSGWGDFRLYSYNGNGSNGTAFVQARDDSGTSSIDLVLRSQSSGGVVDAMRILSNGNVGIGTDTPGTKLEVAGEVTVTACNITSDRNAKEQFKPVNPREVLNKVTSLPITEWQYKSQGDARHIGPMAQDFHEAFSLGHDDKHITSVDADGVALAAIQGLNQKLEEKLAEKAREVEDLKQSVLELRELVNRLTSTPPASR